ncbi:MAG: hypothetical protein QM756_16165 [Polyangiaceae bacterium]
MLAAALVTAACANSQPAPAKPPPVDAETRLGPTRRPAKDEPVRILAPPPAYGNKVVMGQRAASKRF